MAHIRTFVALGISQKIRNNAANLMSRLEQTGAQYNWVPEDNLHITLNFVGDLPDTETPQFCREVKQIVEKHERFGVMVSDLGAFPNSNQPRVVWLGVSEGAEELAALNRELAVLLSDWGVPKDKNDYVPHLTLGRVRRGGRWNDELLEKLHRFRNHDGGWFMGSEVIVYSSHLDRSGPSYTPMSRIKLR